MKLFLTLTAMIFALVTTVFAQYDDISHAQRQINIGLDGANDDTSISLTAIVPVRNKQLSGWLGLFGQQQTEEGRISSQTLNAHLNVAYDLHPHVAINGFGDWTRDHDRGITGQSQIGGFLNFDAYEDSTKKASFGIGNFAENRQVQAILKIKQGDPTVIRTIAYFHARYGRYSFTQKFQPRWDFTDPRIIIEISARYSLAENLDALVQTKGGWEANPANEGENYFSSYQIVFSATY